MRTRTLAVSAFLGLALAACGGGDGGDTDTDTAAPSAEAGVASFVGNDQLQWEETSKTVELVDGELAVDIVCDGTAAHNLLIEGVQDGAVIAECEGGGTGSATVALEAGTYTYFCDIAGHREAGMEGTLTVTG